MSEIAAILPSVTRILPLLLVPLLATACIGDETVSRYAGGVWVLTKMDGGPAPEGVTLNLSEQGRISGQAPCNRYSGSQDVPYPWFETGPIAATRLACPELPAERRYLALLETMTLAEAQGDVLILSGEDGGELVYSRVPG